MRNILIGTILIGAAYAFGLTSTEVAKVTVKAIAPIPVVTEILPAKADIKCLALNIYWESRNDDDSRIGVGHVVMNRVANKHYPDSVCKVVKQGRTWKGNPIRNKCAFSWRCDGKKDIPLNKVAWDVSVVIAKAILKNEISDPTNGSVMYHADYVKPYWAAAYKREVKLGVHIFYTKG